MNNNLKKFAENLDVSSEVAVYAKLPNGFKIPTPVGDYNPLIGQYLLKKAR